MTPDLRVLGCEALGWRLTPYTFLHTPDFDSEDVPVDGWMWRSPDGVYDYGRYMDELEASAALPELNLDLMAQAEAMLRREHKHKNDIHDNPWISYWKELGEIVGCPWPTRYMHPDHIDAIASATAEQRATAFLRVKGKL